MITSGPSPAKADTGGQRLPTGSTTSGTASDKKSAKTKRMAKKSKDKKPSP